MGVFDKIKNLFYEEVEEEEIETEELPVSRVIKKEEEPKEDEMENVISERDLFKSEPTFKFPIMFEDEELERVEKEKHQNILDKYKEEPKSEKKVEEEVPHFRPTPVVSPVYGILDKHYEKDHLPEKILGSTVIEKEEQVVNVDEVRKKAYGTLQDDLEKTMTDDKELFDSVGLGNNEDDMNVLDMTKDLETEISLEASRVTFGDAEENFEEFGLEYDSNKLTKEKKEKAVDKVEEINQEVIDEEKDDLFDMIDSMYDNEEEEI